LLFRGPAAAARPAYRPAGRGAAAEQVPAESPRGPGPHLLLIALTAALGVLVVAWAYRLQLEGGHATAGAVLFWAGLLLAVLPAGARLLSRRAGLLERLYALMLVGGATGAPRILRSDGPLFTDEFAAWRQTVDAVAGASPLIRGGFVPGVEGSPGLHLLVGSLSSVSGLSVWASSVLVLTAAHLIGALAVFALALALLDRPRPAGAAALIYLVNPLSLWSGTRLAPDSLAIPLVLAALALAVRACRVERRGVRNALGWSAAALLLLVALTDVTVALLSVALLTVILVAAVWRTRQHPVQVTVRPDGSVERRLVGLPEYAGLWARLLAVAGVGLLLVAVVLLVTGGAFEQAADWFPSRGFAGMPGSPPVFEVVLTLVAPLLVFLLAAEGVWRLWSHPRRRSGRLLALASLGLLYFPLVPLALLPTIAPTARSAWGLTYLGVALLCAPVLLRRLDALQARESWIVERLSAGPLVSLALAVLLVGNSAASAGAGYRHSGPSRYGAEGRADTVELRSIASGFAADHGRVGILADRYTGPAFAAFSGSRLPRATTLLPGNELMQGADPDVGWVSGLVARGYSYLVVDMRMAGTTPLDGDSFGPDDPGEGRQPRLAALRRLDRVPWVSRVGASRHYRVYRIDLAGAGRPLVEQADAWGEDYGPLPGTPDAALPPELAAALPASAAYGPVALGAAPAGVPQIFPADGSPARPVTVSVGGAASGFGGAPGAAGGGLGPAGSGGVGPGGVGPGGFGPGGFGPGGGGGAGGPGGPAGEGPAGPGGPGAGGPGVPGTPAHPGEKPKPTKPGGTTNPGNPAPGKPAPGKPAPDKPAPGKPAPGKPTPPKAEKPPKPSKPAPGKPDKTKPPKPSKAKPAKPAKPSKAKPAKPAKPSKAKPAKPAKPSKAKPAKPAKPSKAKAAKPPKPQKAKAAPQARSAQASKAAPKAKPAKPSKGKPQAGPDARPASAQAGPPPKARVPRYGRAAKAQGPSGTPAQGAPPMSPGTASAPNGSNGAGPGRDKGGNDKATVSRSTPPADRARRNGS
jgi:hypothetical protein